jgi:hypothetical protein
MSTSTIENEGYRIEEFSIEQVRLIKEALMAQIVKLGSQHNNAGITNKNRKELKDKKMKTFEIYQRI